MLAASGAKVLVVGRSEAGCTDTARAIADAGGTASHFLADVTSLDAMTSMARAAIDRYGRIDVLCANAGIFPQVSIADMTSEQWDEVQAVNLKGMFHAVKACLPAMQEQRYGRVVLTSSITGPFTGFPGWSHYGCSKAGMLGFMRTAALEVAPYGITVNAVLPGNVRTEGLEALGADYMRGVSVITRSRVRSVKTAAA
ncbi:SDR family NAD(P)-dependent oxidoreductase [Sorangium sp. So ce131]|uniref:SDR family NAD(P)-dependent oxidoreductase n=1 Tax=Sorangium sp. So ce131 TaxID=3133282 RepID=UPI003F641E49